MHALIGDPEVDRDLERRVVNFLSARSVPSLRRLRVDVHDGVVTLRGKVHSFYEKQLAINACQRVAGVQRLIDTVAVDEQAALA